MNISLWSSYFIEMDPEEMVRTFSEHDFSCTELSDEHSLMLLGRGNPVEVGKTFLEYAKQHGFSFPQGHLWLVVDIVHPDQKTREENLEKLKSWLELYRALDIKAAVLHPGGSAAAAAGWSEEEISRVRTESLKFLTDWASKGSTVICLENCGQEADELLEMIELVGADNLGVCLDTGHLNLVDEDQETFIDKCGSHLKALHLADNLGQNDNHMLPYSAGTVDWEQVIEALKRNNYSGLFNFEVPGESRCSLPVRMAKLDYVRDLGRIMCQ